MRRKSQILTLLLLLAAIAAVKVGQQVYSWYAHADERTELRRLRAELDTAGLMVVTTQLRADSLRGEIEALDVVLRRERGAMGRFERRADGGVLPLEAYRRYRVELDRYNRRVGRRNRSFEGWRAAMEQNHAAVQHYNAVADSMSGLAARMGAAFYEIPSPIEIGIEHGVLRVDSARG